MKKYILIAFVLISSCGEPTAPATPNSVIEPGDDSSVILPAFIDTVKPDTVKINIDSLAVE
jgi:hypothetical protein